jgi:hypothetical protein
VFRKLRIAVLLLILLFVALNTYFDRVYSTDWDIPLRVMVFPINGDGSDVAERYIAGIQPTQFTSIEKFFTVQADSFAVKLQRPFRFTLASQIHGMPPMLEPGAGAFDAVVWSLRTRYWAWTTPEYPPGPQPDIRLFVLYYNPETSPSLPHSVGLQKGLFAVVNAFADRRMEGSNDVVISHELLHTLGATDKYNLATNQPLLPDGYAEPSRQPVYPQSSAELMGGRIPITATEAHIPESLRQVIVGPMTAAEIGWVTK